MGGVPEVELEAFLLTVAEAVDLAAEGNAGDGYAALLAGLQRACEAQEDGEPWAAVLVKRWTEARDNYANRHHIPRA